MITCPQNNVWSNDAAMTDFDAASLISVDHDIRIQLHMISNNNSLISFPSGIDL
jgi:hypothetical protein